MKILLQRLPMLLVALLLPPLYFVLRKRYIIAIAVSMIMVALANWNAYGPLFGIALAFIAELVQIGYEITNLAINLPKPSQTEQLDTKNRLPWLGPTQSKASNHRLLSRFND